jgi:hypothetical protein
VAGIVGGAVFILISIIVVYLFKTNKVATVKPWATGLSGQLQKAFVTGKSKHLFIILNIRFLPFYMYNKVLCF